MINVPIWVSVSIPIISAILGLNTKIIYDWMKNKRNGKNGRQQTTPLRS